MNKFYEQLDYYTDDLRRDKQDEERYPDNSYMGRETERRGKEITRCPIKLHQVLLTRVW